MGGAAPVKCKVHQGYAKVRGYQKPKSQDYMVAIPELHSLGCALPLPNQSMSDLEEEPSSTGGAGGSGDAGERVRDRMLSGWTSGEHIITSQPASGATLTCIFDGHAGTTSAETAAHRLGELVAQECDMWSRLASSSAACLDAGEEEAMRECWVRLFNTLDREILDASRASGVLDGTTALAGLQYGLKLYIANAGDSRAVLARDGMALPLSRDHSPALPAERERVTAAGGEVQFMRGTWRVMLPMPGGRGMKLCAMSRCLGDRDFKEPRALMSCTPDVTATVLEPEHDQFTIFASDGIWNSLTDQEAVDCLTGVIADYKAREELYSYRDVATAMATQLAQVALWKGALDDISVVVNLYEWCS